MEALERHAKGRVLDEPCGDICAHGADFLHLDVAEGDLIDKPFSPARRFPGRELSSVAKAAN